MLKGVLKFFFFLVDEIVVVVFIFVVFFGFGVDVFLKVFVLFLVFLFFKDILIVLYVFGGGFEKRFLIGFEVLIGMEVVVVEDLFLEGIVKVGNELWRGVCLNGRVKRGEKVRIVGFRGNFLLLECLEF